MGKKRSSDVNEAIKHEKLVRFEVDLALVLSASESFGWSRALKHKLQREMIGVKDHLQSVPTPTLPNSINFLLQTTPLPFLTRPLIPNYCKGSCSKRLKKKSKREEWRGRAKRSVKEVEEDQLKSGLKNLGRLLPGGNEMGVCELLSEVETYIVCLELQVSVLQSLVDM